MSGRSYRDFYAWVGGAEVPPNQCEAYKSIKAKRQMLYDAMFDAAVISAPHLNDVERPPLLDFMKAADGSKTGALDFVMNWLDENG